LETNERFGIRVRINDQKYFLRQSSSGMVGGPVSTDGVGHHITIAVNPETEEISHVHMKSGRGRDLTEDWRIYPSEIMRKLTNWVRNNAIKLDACDRTEFDRSSYVISVRRVVVSFYVLEALVTRLGTLLFRGLGFAPIRVTETDRKAWVLIEVDPERVQERVRLLVPIGKPLLVFFRARYVGILKRALRLHLVSLRDMADGDVCLVFPKNGRAPIVVFKQRDHLGVPLERAMQEAKDLYTKLKLENLRPRLEWSGSEPIRMEFLLKRSGNAPQ